MYAAASSSLWSFSASSSYAASYSSLSSYSYHSADVSSSAYPSSSRASAYSLYCPSVLIITMFRRRLIVNIDITGY